MGFDLGDDAGCTAFAFHDVFAGYASSRARCSD